MVLDLYDFFINLDELLGNSKYIPDDETIIVIVGCGLNMTLNKRERWDCTVSRVFWTKPVKEVCYSERTIVIKIAERIWESDETD